ncbi:MAG: hypothetical protein AAB250_11310 [Bdellovibrionota bacterium]
MNAEAKERLKHQILEIARRNASGITYSSLQNLPGFAGACNLANAEYVHVRFWEGLSEEAAYAIFELHSEGAIKQEPTDELAYMAAGQTLEHPLFTLDLAPQVGSLVVPHWMPVLLVPGRVR